MPYTVFLMPYADHKSMNGWLLSIPERLRAQLAKFGCYMCILTNINCHLYDEYADDPPCSRIYAYIEFRKQILQM